MGEKTPLVVRLRKPTIFMYAIVFIIAIIMDARKGDIAGALSNFGIMSGLYIASWQFTDEERKKKKNSKN